MKGDICGIASAGENGGGELSGCGSPYPPYPLKAGMIWNTTWVSFERSCALCGRWFDVTFMFGS